MASVVNLLTQMFMPGSVQTPAPVTHKTSNPYGNNPFVNYNGNQYESATYAKNKPVSGGYFAGYYNGKQNIVGRRLFIEV